jgi:hypothetical protein
VLILDTPAQERWSESGAREREQQLRAAALAQEIASNTISVNIEDGWDCSSFEQRVGHPLLTQEVIRRLKLCNSGLIFERSVNFPSMTGIYFEKDERTATGSFAKRKVFLFTLSSGEIMPEMEVAHVRMKKVPNPEVVAVMGGSAVARDAVHWIEVPTVYDLTRGWRTVLIRLLRAGLVTRGEVSKHFDWTPSVPSANWAAQT